MADIGAKDGSQETIINLVGMLAGTVLVTRIDELGSDALILWATWLLFLVLTGLHLLSNYLAVRNVVLDYLNPQRLEIVCTEFFDSGHILTPAECAQRESIFWWHFRSRLPKITMGALYSSNNRKEWLLPRKARYRLRVGRRHLAVALSDLATEQDMARGCIHAYHEYYQKILETQLRGFDECFEDLQAGLIAAGWQPLTGGIGLHMVDAGHRYKQAKTK